MRYFLTFTAMLGLLFLALFLLFRGGGTPKTLPAHRALSSYATTDAQAILTIDGPVNSDQVHKIIRITVDNTAVTFRQLQGYQGNVVNARTFSNNENAYVNFLLALEHANFTRGNNNPNLKDERGYCPLGNRYIFELTQNGNDVERYWATSCGSPKTYLGALNLTIQLFQAQVPGYADLTQNFNL